MQLFAIGQSVAVSLQTVAGLGQPIENLSASQIARFQKVRNRYYDWSLVANEVRMHTLQTFCLLGLWL